MNRQFFAVIIIIIAAFAGVLLISNKKDKAADGGGNISTQVQASQHVSGKKDSKVTLIEYGDFQCPACKSYYPIVNELKATYGDRVAFQFRHYPLTQIHPNAFLGSRAAQAAGKQGKFFEMHDLLYENQESWSAGSNAQPVLEGYAQQLALNLDHFKSDFNSSETTGVINADLKAGQKLGVNSTPTFALNNKKIDQNPRSVDEFKKLLDDALAANQ